jgi:hypothetical protein
VGVEGIGAEGEQLTQIKTQNHPIMRILLIGSLLSDWSSRSYSISFFVVTPS